MWIINIEGTDLLGKGHKEERGSGFHRNVTMGRSELECEGGYGWSCCSAEYNNF